MLILGIETSCDETAAAVVEDGRKVLSSIVHSQIKDHQEWGGVIPELASRLHIQQITRIIDKALEEASSSLSKDISIEDIDAIAVSNRPGLVGSLLVGVNAAKTLAWMHNKPLIATNHLHGHVCANFIDSDLEAPFICLLASGGHTQIIKVTDYADMEILGETIDDAAGEAFDKVARLFELPYPGGPHLDKLAQQVTDKKKFSFTIPKVKGYDFSFSGLKTAVLRLKEKLSEEEWFAEKANIAYAFQDCVAKTFYKKILVAVENEGLDQIVLAGGVAANSGVRGLFKENFPEENLVFPSLRFCTDNAAMIASAGYFLAKDKDLSKLSLEELDCEVASRTSTLV